MANLDKIIFDYYLPYAKSVIIERALPAIDGLKPVQRRVLVEMEKLGLLNKDADHKKSQKILGMTMGIHPHGDSSIYDAMQLMTDKYNGLNVPYLDGKGSFGKIYSRDLKCAAPRYTNAKLAPICREMFEGIKENAVDIIDNYDGTEKEPALLPVKFPNILVNGSSGVAVGTSTEIPAFSLEHVCRAVQGIIRGTIKTPADLAEVLVCPEFTTGGFIHSSAQTMEKLCRTGRGSFVISGKVEVYSNRIVVTEIPYVTTAEDIVEAVEEAVKEKKLRGVTDVYDEIGKDGFSMVIEVKRGFDSRAVLKELCIMTPIRTSVSYRTKVIINDRCQELGLLELLQKWIEWRKETISRVYNFRLDRDNTEEHVLKVWEIIKDDIAKVAKLITDNTTDKAKEILMTQYKLDDIQAEYLLDKKIRSLTTDSADSALKKLAAIRDSIQKWKYTLNHLDEKICEEQEEIIKTYAVKTKTTRVDELKEEDLKLTPVKISSDVVTVVYTKNGYVRRLTSINDMTNKFVSKTGDEEVLRWTIRNNQHILVFDRFGIVHKVLVDNIDASNKAVMQDELYKLAGLEKAEDMIYADACGDYSGYFNLLYPNGKGTRVFYDKASGNRTKYKAYYDEVQPGRFWITKENKFFMITLKNKAAYCDLTRLNQLSNRSAFKVARTPSGDPFVKIMSYNDLPNPDLIDITKYNRGYAVQIGDDYFWKNEETERIAKQVLEDHMKKYKVNEQAEEDTNDSEENINDSEANTEDVNNSEDV